LSESATFHQNLGPEENQFHQNLSPEKKIQVHQYLSWKKYNCWFGAVLTYFIMISVFE